MDRSKKIVRTSILGIAANVLLASVKAAVGAMTSSIAITLDAVNNLSDALSSTVTAVGTKLAGKKPDKKHPYGYGRIEYIGATVIAVIILYAGISSLVESVKKIISPQIPDYPTASLIMVGAAVVIKIALGVYFLRVGKAARSEQLSASGKDALFDAVISLSTLIAAGVFIISDVGLEAYLGAVISLFILKSGVQMLVHTLSEILGERVDANLTKAIKQTITSFPEVHGAYDLILHNYGPDTVIGSVHIEVDDNITVDKLDVLEHKISEKVYSEHKVFITGISVYAKNTKNELSAAVLDAIRQKVLAHEHVLQIHGFYINEADRTIHFDVIIDFSAPDRAGEYNAILEEVKGMFPDYDVTITLDSDISD